MVAIASGGCNVLSYLVGNPERITAVDLDSAHIALTKLELAAARRLENYAGSCTSSISASASSCPRPIGICWLRGSRAFRSRLSPHFEREICRLAGSASLTGEVVQLYRGYAVSAVLTRPA